MTRILPLLVLLSACSSDPVPLPEGVYQGPLDVRSTSFPAHWLTERIGGHHVRATNLLPVGEDAPHWQPPPDRIAELASADLIVANGAGHEAWMATATLPSDRLVYTAHTIQLIEVEAVTHSHGTDGDHSHSTVDPHTWGSPAVYARQGRALAQALSKADPERADDYTVAAEGLEAELKGITEAYAEAFSRAGDTQLASNHATFNYLARQLEVEIHAFDFDPAQVPDEDSLAGFTTWAGDAEAPVLLWDAQPSPEVMMAFPEGVRHLQLDALDQPPPGGAYDYMAQVRANIAAVGDLFPLGEIEGEARPMKGPVRPIAPALTKPGPKVPRRTP